MNSYWLDRFERLKSEQMGRIDQYTATDMRDIYAYALQQITKEVNDWYSKYSEDNIVSLADSRKLLDARELKAFKMTLKEYIKECQKLGLSDKHRKMLENASTRARLSRSQQLLLSLTQEVQKLGKLQETDLTDILGKTYEESTYKTAYLTQDMLGQYAQFARVPTKTIQTVLTTPWTDDGKDFSDRIWADKDKLAFTLQTEMTRSLLIQEGSGKLAERLSKRMNVSLNNALRLAETETAYVQEKAMYDVYTDLGVEQYQILAVLDKRTSSICRHLDGKVFDKPDYKIGVTAPPFHARCRSTTVPYIKGVTDAGTRVYRDSNGKTQQARGDITYEDWEKEYLQ